jgi:hypothetical protein
MSRLPGCRLRFSSLFYRQLPGKQGMHKMLFGNRLRVIGNLYEGAALGLPV